MRHEVTLLAAAVWLVLAGKVNSQAATTEFLNPDLRAQDFDAFCEFVSQEYAYFDRKLLDWPSTCRRHAAEAVAATDHDRYLRALERTLAELYDNHAHFVSATADSPRLVPTGTNLLVRWHGNRALVDAVKDQSPALLAGVLAGDEILMVQGRPVGEAAAEFMPRSASPGNAAAWNWALNVAIAGRRNLPAVSLHIKRGAVERDVSFAPNSIHADSLLSVRRYGRIVALRVNNSLGEMDLIKEFDHAIDSLADTDALIVDLRDTPSGGTSTVARGLMGRLVRKTAAYQRHESIAEFKTTGIRRMWVEYVVPRPPTYRKPVVVLVGPWTGSMGEGIAIGLDATGDAVVAGQQMSGLLGALDQRELPESKIVVRVPAERLTHVNGTPREDFVPCRLTIGAANTAAAATDPQLHAAVKLALDRGTAHAARRGSGCAAARRSGR
jgi:C-terminal processing protease CtpA/Prc